MGEFITVFAEKISKKGVHTNLLTILMVIMACIWLDRRVSRWERVLANIQQSCWTTEYMVEYDKGLRNIMHTNTPDPHEIIKEVAKLRRAEQQMQEQGD